jgi:hypothetical protein
MNDIAEQMQTEFNWIRGEVFDIHDMIEKRGSQDGIEKLYFEMANGLHKVQKAYDAKNYRDFFLNMETLKGVCGTLIREL